MKGRFFLLLPYLAAVAVATTLVWHSDWLRLANAHAISVTSARVDPVCGMEVGTTIEEEWNGGSYHFCAERCREIFSGSPRSYAGEICLVCKSRGDLNAVDAERRYEATWQDRTYSLCSAEHRAAFQQDPGGYLMHTMWGIPNWLYYVSIAAILAVSFGAFEWRAAGRTPGGAGAPRVLEAPGSRVDLLQFAWLRRLLVWPATRFALQGVVVGFFALIVVSGLFGNQLPSKNIAPLLTWTVWWGGLIILILYAGKAWCYVCPWDAIAGWAEGLRFWGRKKEGLGLGLSWPGALRNIWLATVLFVGLTWIEIGFGVTMRPRVTAWLGIAMLCLAFVSAFIFERKSFCRYACLVGRVSGLYALFSPVEIRAADREVCRTCSTPSCYEGNDAGEPCPTFQYLGGMEQNTYCISCMECLKSCEKGNVALRLRPWGADLSSRHRARPDEAYLALLMLSLTGFHGLTMTGVWREVLGWIERSLDVGETVAFSAGMGALMVAPALLFAGLVALSRWFAGASTATYRTCFIRYAYALLPIALFYHIAHNSEHLLMEGQKVVALLSDPLGQQWDLLGTARWSLPPLVRLPTLWGLQVLLVMAGHVYSLWVSRCTAGSLFPDSRAALRSQIPMLGAMVLFSLMSLWLLKQPMEMRTSAM
ncbi:MAG: YHS domain-containing protein [Candidatus Latescibacteria bacterium]|nr:YHS domain-containing protein [Candidatus Latescibacterota bacterium]